jgi:hypothetical protein
MGGSGWAGAGAAIVVVAFDFVDFFVCELMFKAATAPIQTTAIPIEISRLLIAPPYSLLINLPF